VAAGTEFCITAIMICVSLPGLLGASIVSAAGSVYLQAPQRMLLAIHYRL